ncbi:hypothetical protein MMC29_002287 [Sticta canariensis]|nr:hypothetical protein [Sticta canariensis]
MALEAATQVIEIDGIDSQNIRSYELRDIILHTALIVPDNNRGVDLLLALHQVSLSNNSYHKYLYTFIVTSVTESNNGEYFIEHARGHVGVNFEDSGKSKTIKSDLVAKTNGLLDLSYISQDFCSDRAHLWPAFQGLSGVNADGNNQIAEANILLTPTAFQSFRESRYVLHSTALDAAIQLSIIATHSGMATRLKRPFLPVN